MTAPLYVCTEHVEGTDPRRAGHCVKCDSPITPRPPSTRDPALEDEMLGLALEAARRLYHAESARFAQVVKERLVLGDERHGNTYHERDCVAEAAEEAPDLASWTLLDLQKAKAHLSEQEFQQLRQAALPVMVAGAMAYAAIEQYRLAREEVIA